MKNNNSVDKVPKRRNKGDGALRQLPNGNWEGAEKIYRQNGTCIRKSVTRADKKEVLLIKKRLKALEPLDPPGSPVPGILQVRTLEWVAISFSNA